VDFDKKQFIHLVNKKKEYKMKNQILSLTLSLVVLFFFVSSVSFAQNQPVKKDVKNNKQEITKETQEHTGTTQDQMKKNESKVNNQMDTKQIQTNTKVNQNQKMQNKDNKVTMDKEKNHATMTKTNKNNESVNKEYHKKQMNTSDQKQIQEKSPTKGGIK